MRRLLASVYFVVVMASAATLSLLNAQQAVYQQSQTYTGSVAPGAQPAIFENSNVTNHTITWTISGAVTSCTVQLESSSMQSGFTLVGTPQTCGPNGGTYHLNGVANTYVRINITSLSATGTVTITYRGLVGVISDTFTVGKPNITSDFFNRTASNLGSNYTDYTNSFAPTAGTATGTNTTNYNVSAFNVLPQYPTQDVTAVVNPNSNFYTGVAVRVSGTVQSAENSYACIESSTTLFLVKRVGMTPTNGGSQTVLKSVSVTTTSADVINLRVIGNTLSCYWNRTGATIEYNDSSSPVATGYPGIIMDGNSSSTVPSISAFTIAAPSIATGTTLNIVVDGDSTTEGAGIFSRWTDYITTFSGYTTNVTNVAVDGKGLCTNRPAGGVNGGGSAGTLEQILATGLTVDDPLFVPGIVNVSVLGPTVNDIANSGTPATAAATEYACLTTWVANRHAAGWKVVVTPALSSSSNDTVMQQYNQLVLANTAGADAVVNLPQSMVGTHAYSNTTFFSDGVHPTQLGATNVIAPAVSAAINSLL